MQQIRIAALVSAVAIGLLPSPVAALFEHTSGTVPRLSSARAVASSGSAVYLGDGSAGLRSFEASDPSAPVEAGGVDTPGYVLGITVAGDRAFVADYRSGLRILDISNSLAPFEVGSNSDLGEVWSVAVVGPRAYVVDEPTGLRVVDISNEVSPVEDHSVELAGCLDAFASAGKVYAACFQLHILDAASPGETTIMASLALPGRALAVVVAGAHAYVACQDVGIVVVDVADPSAPFLASPGLLAASQVPRASDLVLIGDRLVVSERDFGIHLLDVSLPGAPRAAGSIAIAGSADAVAASGAVAFVASGGEGLHLANLDPACLDGVDNDGDGAADFPGDPGCAEAGDPSEEAACSDALDNDGDGQVDEADPGCSAASDSDERTGAGCDDGIDNDGDGARDLEDPGCEDVFDGSERAEGLVCDDGIDNDDDGLTDYPNDPECDGLLDFSESARCADGVDNDGDGAADHPEDPGCSDPEDESERLGTVCDNGEDEDGDGAFDYPLDPGCSGLGDASELNQAVACDDGLDNDEDGVSDWPDDPGCPDLLGGLEDPACSDGVDDDDDGSTDYPADPGCSSPSDESEAHACSDGLDNDSDGATDFGADLGCNSPTDPTERSGAPCDDGIDNDSDGLVDLEDPGCLSIQSSSESPECDDGLDNDGDELADYPEDPGCTGSFDDSESGGDVCDDGIDNDADGRVDYPADPGCSSIDDPSELASESACDDGIDNDGDGGIDFPDDPECLSPTHGYEAPACDDGADNDHDGLADGDDPGCAHPSQTLEAPACDDGNDNDGDGLVDLDDAECDGASDLSERRLNPADVIVVGPRSLTRIDARSGQASVLADGADFRFLGDVVLAEPGRLFVSDLTLGSVFEVDADTGEGVELASGLDLGGGGIAVGGGIDVDANGMLMLAAADGLYSIDPDTAAKSRVIESTPGVGFLGNFLDVRVEAEGTALVSRFSATDEGPRFEVVRFDPTRDLVEPVWSADPALGPGFNGSLALEAGGDVFVSQAGTLSRIDPGEGTRVGEADTSGLFGFGGIAEDVGGGLVALEHCGPVGTSDCAADGVRVIDAVANQVIPGGELSGMSLELIVVQHDCSDGLDGDGDWLVDDADPDCRSSFGLSEWRSKAVPEPAAALLRFLALAVLALLARPRASSAKAPAGCGSGN